MYLYKESRVKNENTSIDVCNRDESVFGDVSNRLRSSGGTKPLVTRNHVRHLRLHNVSHRQFLTPIQVFVMLQINVSTNASKQIAAKTQNFVLMACA